MDFSQEILDSLKINRKELHKIPEVGFKEFKTQQYIIKILSSLGFSPKSICDTGVSLFIDNKKESTIAFRADIDALPILEENDIEFKSTHEGYMHACGHDGHSAILLGFAHYLSQTDLSHLNYNILLIFQPAEETPGGAKDIAASGILEQCKVKSIFGLHISPKLEEGYIGSRAGGFMAKASEINVDIFGKSGHCGQPQSSIDSIQAAIKFLEQINCVVAKNLSPFDPSLISFNKIQGGTIRNIVAEHTRIEGTIRSFSKESFEFIKNKIFSIKTGLEIGFDVKIDVDINSGYPPVVNDNELYKILQNSVNSSSNLKFIELEPEMLAEDFSFYLEKIPGVFFFLGSKNIDKGYIHPLHNSKFNFDEKVLEYGIEAYVILLETLNNKY
ncbi:MAG: amidohydrolase [Fusobacteriaceae bacterium]|nr:amidohydrolase [Fusobacteriaceae bacterium]